VTSCPGCGRTTSTYFQKLAEDIQGYLREQMPVWRERHPGVEEMKVAVMGCVVNGPGRVQARQPRHLAARHLRGAQGAGLRGRRALHHLRGDHIAEEFQRSSTSTWRPTTHNGDEWFHAASTIKVPVLVGVFAAIREGGSTLDSRVHVRNRFLSVVDGAPFRVESSRDANSEVHAASARR
jgi:hypothetical protein